MSYRPFSIVLAIAYIVVAVAGQFKLPAEVKTCKRGTDDYSSCLRLAIQESWPVFVKGIPEINFPSLDPYYMDHNKNEFGSGELHGSIETWEVYIYGMKNMRFLAVRPEYTDDFFKLEVDLECPKNLIEGKYKAEGNLASFKIGGQGDFNVSTEDVKVTWTISGPIKDDRWVVEHYIANVQIGKLKVWCTDLFNGNEELTKTVLAFVNEYWPTIYHGMYPYFASGWDEYFSKVVYTQSFPEKALFGDYEFNGVLFSSSIHNRGKFTLTLYDLIQTTTITKSPGQKIKVNVNVQTIRDLKLHISNLLFGREILEGVLDRIINGMWQPGFAVTRGLINELVSTAFTDIFGRAFKNFPFERIVKPKAIRST